VKIPFSLLSMHWIFCTCLFACMTGPLYADLSEMDSTPWFQKKNKSLTHLDQKTVFQTYLLYNERLTGRKRIFGNIWNCKKRNIWEKRR
jgi:hypothetical protein